MEESGARLQITLSAFPPTCTRKLYLVRYTFSCRLAVGPYVTNKTANAFQRILNNSKHRILTKICNILRKFLIFLPKHSIID
jgi:hypothetical protein